VSFSALLWKGWKSEERGDSAGCKDARGERDVSALCKDQAHISVLKITEEGRQIYRGGKETKLALTDNKRGEVVSGGEAHGFEGKSWSLMRGSKIKEKRILEDLAGSPKGTRLRGGGGPDVLYPGW